MSNIILGAIERKKDSRDFNLGKIQATQEIPEEYLPDISDIKRNFQGLLPTCGAHALSHLKQIQETVETGSTQHFTPRYNWIQIKQVDGYGLEDGTDMRSVFKSLQTDGVLNYDVLGNDYSLPIDKYSDKSVVTEEMKESANPFVIGSYAFLTSLDMYSMKQAIYKNRVSIILMQVGPGFWHTNYPKDEERPWGHFVIATGYTKDSIRILESADPDSQFATKYLDKDYIRAIREFGTCVDIPNNLVPILKKKLSILKQLVQLYLKLKDMGIFGK